MNLDEQHLRWMDGAEGGTMKWAMEFNLSLGQFFNAEEMLPVTSAHFAPDLRLGGTPSVELLERAKADGVRVKVPSYLDPCSVDFGRAAEMVSEYGLTETFVEGDKRLQRLCKEVGFIPTYSCINYQSVSPPARGETLAWGDTGTAIMANAVFGARTNFEGGPSAFASALLGSTPAYGMHLDENRQANLIVRLDCNPAEAADWGAIAALTGVVRPGYTTVPVFCGDFALPTFPMLKQLGVALASYGGHAMFHVIGATPEAPNLEAALGGNLSLKDAAPDRIITQQDLDAAFTASEPASSDIDFVVFAAPQLAIDEIIEIQRLLNGRKVHENTRMIIALDPQVKGQADSAGISDAMNAQGVEFSTGTCFYPEAPLMRIKSGGKTLVTNAAKLVNTLRPSGFDCVLRRLKTCVDAAVSGRL